LLFVNISNAPGSDLARRAPSAAAADRLLESGASIHRLPLLPAILHTPRSAFFVGLRDQLPATISILPFGLITGAASSAAGMDPWLAIGMSCIVYAGASQLAAISLMAQHAPAVIVVLTVLVVNLRMVMYSAALAPRFRDAPTARKWLLSYLLTDHGFALVQARFTTGSEQRHQDFYYLGAACLMWITWQIMVVIGVFAGTLVPTNWSLDFAIPLVFLALVLPALQTRAHWSAALAAMVAAAFTSSMPLKLGLISASLVGVVIGSWLDARDERLRLDGGGSRA
jgi:4-azaleucine resistance transporter AzlC